ncbi:hypothetical protein HY524_01715 [Candidatus Berkelbacteria bacterium]|nr:hypothetical protein [Candidatus Berkelbacteria bacterium]
MKVRVVIRFRHLGVTTIGGLAELSEAKIASLATPSHPQPPERVKALLVRAGLALNTKLSPAVKQGIEEAYQRRLDQERRWEGEAKRLALELEQLKQQLKFVYREWALGSSIPIENIGLCVRSLNPLIRAGIDSLQKLIQWSEAELAQLKNFSAVKSIPEIKSVLAEYGLTFKLP